jgi:hypothetical protein
MQRQVKATVIRCDRPRQPDHLPVWETGAGTWAQKKIDVHTGETGMPINRLQTACNFYMILQNHMAGRKKPGRSNAWGE